MNHLINATEPDMFWVSDVKRCGNLARGHLARINDVFAPRIAGWRARRKENMGVVLDAVEQVIHHRKPAQDLLGYHSGRRLQDLSINDTELLAAAKSVSENCSVRRQRRRPPMTMLWQKRSTVRSKPRSWLARPLAPL